MSPLVGLELWCYERKPYGLYDKGSSPDLGLSARGVAGG